MIIYRCSGTDTHLSGCGGNCGIRYGSKPLPHLVPGERHVDLIRKDLANSREVLQERIPEADNRTKHAGYNGDYARYSELHTMEECPFE